MCQARIIAVEDAAAPKRWHNEPREVLVGVRDVVRGNDEPVSRFVEPLPLPIRHRTRSANSEAHLARRPAPTYAHEVAVRRLRDR